jgi:hypothetical protein
MMQDWRDELLKQALEDIEQLLALAQERYPDASAILGPDQLTQALKEAPLAVLEGLETLQKRFNGEY